VCKLEVAQMGAFARAKLAARQKGLGTTKIESDRVPYWKMVLRPIVIVPAIIVCGLVLYFTRPTPPPAWESLPPTQMEAARQVLADISTGKDEGYDKAYALIAPSAKDSKDSDDIGKYRQLFHVMNNYLSSEFGSDWMTITTLEAEKGDADLIAAHIGPETLHLRAQQQTPAEKLKERGSHYAIEGVDEFNIADAADLQKMAGITGVLRGEAGQGAVNNLQTILSAGGGNRHESPMHRKLRILPNLRNPRSVVRRTVLQAWPLRKDPVIRARLEQIATDGRYPVDVKDTAEQVLKNNVPDEDLIAAGVE